MSKAEGLFEVIQEATRLNESLEIFVEIFLDGNFGPLSDAFENLDIFRNELSKLHGRLLELDR